jgi:hypothetical protein
VKAKDNWRRARDEILASGTDEAKIGLAHAAVNLWSDEISLLEHANKRLVAVVMDVFRVTDELVLDASTTKLLHQFADPNTDMSAAPSHFVVERLQALLPHEALLVATIAEKLISAWRTELGDMRTGTAMAAPQLTDLALTLHRLGGTSRQAGIALFESMIEIDAHGARETLAEIDGRFGQRQAAARQRISKRKSRARRRATA